MSRSDRTSSLGLLAACLFPFIILATANSAGYRYGASDQAFYAPAILKRIDPALYPRDSEFIRSQARLTLVDEVLGPVARATGAPLSTAFVVLQLTALSLLALAARAYRRRSLPDTMGDGRADGGTDAAPRDHQVGHEHARRLFSPAPVVVRDRRARRRQLPARPLRRDVRARGCRRSCSIRRPLSGSPSG